MSNEIYHSLDNTYVLYAIVYEYSSGEVWNGAAFETWNNANILTYDIPMVAAGDMHFADFPAVDYGNYIVQIRRRDGGAPSVDDKPIAQGFMAWDGIQEITIQYIIQSNGSDISPLTQAIKDLETTAVIVQNTSNDTKENKEVYTIRNL